MQAWGATIGDEMPNSIHQRRRDPITRARSELDRPSGAPLRSLMTAEPRRQFRPHTPRVRSTARVAALAAQTPSHQHLEIRDSNESCNGHDFDQQLRRAGRQHQPDENHHGHAVVMKQNSTRASSFQVRWCCRWQLPHHAGSSRGATISNTSDGMPRSCPLKVGGG